MSERIDIAGQRFGRLIIIRLIGKTAYGKALWHCKCDCGNLHNAVGSQLRRGHTKSCGCLRVDGDGATNKLKHGYARKKNRHPLYRTWSNMHQRCGNLNNKRYKDYGGRGIKVCKRWDSFEHFAADVGERPSPDFSLGRIDNDRGYSPDNCEWQTGKEQRANSRPGRTPLDRFSMAELEAELIRRHE